ncbi:hypothetical protein QEV83_08725 [Methylocapsa sp. D3K7]|uniref:hypothetical protein n=1 Tax=Methylocapsa sp. D3K7 TaxID=3041435 RepID=UPI00244E66E2|nr:hypothetical protein [Methylocapsa sp. D3K7]WGJ16305.1 hypothetical protein QEV83_08725 [Methylocapsa sp. D3K7]
MNCSNLQPGDFLLSQTLDKDAISSLIEKVQRDGGYAADDGKWSHAMYLGDQENVVEATFDDIHSGVSVRITSIDEYSDGRYALRFRRPRKVTSESDGWKLCVRALSRLCQPYAFAQAAKLWWDVVIRKSGFYSGRNQRTTSEAVICSTLYADSYNEAFRSSSMLAYVFDRRSFMPRILVLTANSKTTPMRLAAEIQEMRTSLALRQAP